MSIDLSRTDGVLSEVRQERTRQEHLWGQQDLPTGTGPLTRPLLPLSPAKGKDVEDAFRRRTDWATNHGSLTYADVLLEEVFEAMAEVKPSRIREELIQVAASAVKFIESIDRQTAAGALGFGPDEREFTDG